MTEKNIALAGVIDRYIVEKCFKMYHPDFEVEPINVPILRDGIIAVEDPEISGPIRVMLEHASCIEESDEQESFILASLQESYEHMMKTGEWIFFSPDSTLGNYGVHRHTDSRRNCSQLR